MSDIVKYKNSSYLFRRWVYVNVHYLDLIVSCDVKWRDKLTGWRLVPDEKPVPCQEVIEQSQVQG